MSNIWEEKYQSLVKEHEVQKVHLEEKTTQVETFKKLWGESKDQVKHLQAMIGGFQDRIEKEEMQTRARDAEAACKMANHRIEELEGDVKELKKLLELVSPLARYSLEESKQ